ncbi:MAG TPA: ribosome-associated translation inhibitor RaiA [Candidatus Cybelea sp.]|nr:ribosome-associated translation inhibitor RaiA [Candidatus Cybelea sp.]
MKVQVSGKHIDIGDALRGHVEDRIVAVVAKYFDKAVDAATVFSREAHLYRADCSVHVGSGISAQSHGTADEIYASLDVALERLEKQLRRHKRKLRNHHPHPGSAGTEASPPSEPPETRVGSRRAATAKSGH